MAKKATLQPTYKGYNCKTPGCGGHKAGHSYASSGGSIPSPHSQSFNEGMTSYQYQITAPKVSKPKSLVSRKVLGALAAGAALGAKKGG